MSAVVVAASVAFRLLRPVIVPACLRPVSAAGSTSDEMQPQSLH